MKSQSPRSLKDWKEHCEHDINAAVKRPLMYGPAPEFYVVSIISTWEFAKGK